MSFLLLLTDKSTAEKDWGSSIGRSLKKMKSKNNFYKEKENKIKSRLSNRIKNIIQTNHNLQNCVREFTDISTEKVILPSVIGSVTRVIRKLSYELLLGEKLK